MKQVDFLKDFPWYKGGLLLRPLSSKGFLEEIICLNTEIQDKIKEYNNKGFFGIKIHSLQSHPKEKILAVYDNIENMQIGEFGR